MDLVSYAKQRGAKMDRLGFPRKLGQLFPADNPYSAAMWRLAIIRDDLDREVEGMIVRHEDDERSVWESSYFLRHLTVSVLEAKSLVDQEVSTLLKRRALATLTEGTHDLMSKEVAALRQELDAAEEILRPVRDGIGGHVRPNNANPERATTEAYETRGLRALADWPGTVTMNKLSAIGTSYRDFTKAAVLFVWPEATTEEGLLKKLEEFSGTAIGATTRLQAAIDGVLFAFWIELGVMEPMKG